MALVIEKKQIKDWLGHLKERFRLIDARKAVLPVKQYFLPPGQEIFVFNKKNGRLSSPATVSSAKSTNQKNLLIFGLDLADLEAMTQLDEIMKKPQPDFFYWQRREKAILVGLSDKSVEVAPGGDLILERINPRQYQARIITNKGNKLLDNKFFKEIKNPPLKRYSAKSTPLKEMLLDSELLAEAVAWSVNHKIWDELAKKCLACGICSYLCPLCYCFSIEDRVSLDNRKAVRYRQWDACTLPDFAKIAGGHSFHQSIKERYYNWFYHKFVRAYKEYGKSQCVACGRCQKYCPAGIDIEKVLIEIVGDYKKEIGRVKR